jgi:nicotinate phosphoribosyltransferase
MPEGTLFFPNEPIIRITAPIIEAQFVEMFLTNAVYLQTILASKISRFVTAANGKQIGVGVGRCYGVDTAMMSARINEIFGNANPLALYHYKHNSTAFGAGTFHFLLMAFANEADAFRAYLRRMHGKGYVLIDTYNSERGLKHFVKVAKELEKEGIKAIGVQLDSGDLYALSVLARKMFDEAGMPYLKIFGMSNLDEWKVADLERRGAPIDVYGGLTQLLTPVDAPTMELVYKLSEVQHRGTVEPKMKTSTQKVSLPGRKQVFRHEKAGRYIADTLSLEEEKLDDTPLLQPIIRQGKLVTKLSTLKQIHDHFFAEKKKFDPALFSVDKKFHYPVAVSDALQQLAKKTRENISKTHHHDLDG